jgi:DNA integrity scanning protein DisA with diadenylate cyclase activity
MWRNIEALFDGLYIPHVGLMDIAEMALIIYVLYKFIVSIKDTRTMLLIKAIFILLGIYFIAENSFCNIIYCFCTKQHV